MFFSIKYNIVFTFEQKEMLHCNVGWVCQVGSWTNSYLHFVCLIAHRCICMYTISRTHLIWWLYTNKWIITQERPKKRRICLRKTRNTRRMENIKVQKYSRFLISERGIQNSKGRKGTEGKKQHFFPFKYKWVFTFEQKMMH